MIFHIYGSMPNHKYVKGHTNIYWYVENHKYGNIEKGGALVHLFLFQAEGYWKSAMPFFLMPFFDGRIGQFVIQNCLSGSGEPLRGF